MTRRSLPFIGPLFATVAGCALISGTSVAVVNPTDQTFYLRVENEAIWHIPPNSEGIGPTDLEFSGGRLVEILTADCQTYESLELLTASTITVLPVYNSTSRSGTGGIEGHLARADDACPMR